MGARCRNAVRDGDAVTVEQALATHGGRIAYSCTLDEGGRTLGERNEGRARYRCGACGDTGHIARRCNGAGAEPKPSLNHRDAARAELKRREDERRARAREVIDAHLARSAAVSNALPVDEDADRRVMLALQRRSERARPFRKLLGRLPIDQTPTPTGKGDE